ncbi:MAG: efflux RND transporter permease subunit [Methylovirgula sp.]
MPPPTPARHRLAFGLERMGLVSLRHPAVVAIVILLLAIGAGLGIGRIKVDDSLSQLFRSNTPAFKQYEEVTKRFPSSEFDVLVVVNGKNLLARASLEKLRDLVTDLQLIDGTRGIISIFSARERPENGHIPPPLFPETLPKGAAYDALVHRIMANEILRGKLLSDDGKLTLMVLSLEPKIVESNALGRVIGEVRSTMNKDLAGTHLTAELSGVPVMQLAIRNAVERDRLLYNTIGFVGGCLIAILFFRRISFMIIATAPPLLAILLALGTLGWLDFQLNMFLNVMTPLIMVISFSDSMQLTFAARDRILAGDSKFEALRTSIYVVGPACVLTHATAALSFVALTFSDSDLIRAFGEAGLIATIIAMLSVLIFLPLLGVLLLRREAAFVARVKGADLAVDALRRFCAWIATRMVHRPGIYSLISVVLVVGLGTVYASLEPRYQLADQVPNNQHAIEANRKLDAALTGASPIDVLIDFPKGQSLYSPETLATIAAVHKAVEKQAGIGNVWSLETLRRWLAEKAGKSDVATLKLYVDMLPKYLTHRFVAANQDAVVVEGRVPDVDSSRLLPIVDSLDKTLNTVRAEHKGYTIAVTGLAVIAARNSSRMIEKLNHGLTIEIVFVAAFIGLAFRSPLVMLAAIMPAIFPVFASGALLLAMGMGLQFSSVVALTVSFGLGLSATIHFLNRLRLERRQDEDPAIGVERATVLVGPAVILTSIVLACGLFVTVFSNLPSLRLFGWLSAFAMLMALVADLTILRPTIMLLYRWAGTKHKA